MSGKPFYAYLFCILILSLGTSYGDTNVLTNPGFESGITGWSDRSCLIEAVTSPVHSGSQSGRAYNRAYPWQGIQQNVLNKMVIGQTYQISGWVRIDGATSATVIVSFEQQDGSGTHYYNVDSVTANNSSWVQLSSEFTPDVTGTLTVLDIYFEGPPADVDIYVDDVSVVLIGSGDWEAEANQRIEQIRKGDFRITAVAPNNPNLTIPDVNVQVIQTRHRFAFGACLAYSPLSSNNSYRNFFLDHFEWAVCENEMKWGSNEPNRDVETYSQADYIANWCADNDIILRGHCVLWEQNNSQMPSWVPGLDCYAYDEENPSEMQEEIDERINSIVDLYKGQIASWDVDNEMLSDNTFGCLGEAGRAHMFELANQIDPNCGMYMNEYSGNSFTTNYDGDAYASRANGLIALGAPVEGLGIQAHLNSPFQPENYYNNLLQELAVVGLPIIATEFDTSASTETQRADDLENFYRICFSHANVEGIIMWGFWENSAWRWGGIVNSDWTLNEAGDRYEALMDEWTTNDSEITDSNGNADFRGFYGTYTVTLTPPGVEPTVVTIDVTPDDPNEFTIELAGLPTPANCQQVQDLGLKLPADLDGNCYIDYTDLFVLADQWLSADPVAIPPYYSPDIYADGQIDMRDLCRLADFWLQCNDPEDPNCTSNW